MLRISMPRVLSFLSAICLVAVVAPASAQKKGSDLAPAQNYICPHSDDKSALDCYFDAVPHLYTMCKHVKSIEIIEFGYEQATEGTHGAKSEYCIAKQTQNIAKPYQGALREAAISQQATEAMKGLQDYWVTSMTNLAWRPGESDADYKVRTADPYERFKERIAGIKEILTIVKSRATTPVPATPKAREKAKR
jgi:hypothetical protein